MRRHTLRTVAAVLAVAATLTGCAAAPVAPAGTGSASERGPRAAQLTPCTDLPALPAARCGSIVVPLDRADPDVGSTTVGFALLPRTDRAQPALGTVAVNPGGPGPSVIDLSGEAFAAALAPVLDRRDLLLVDPRGVGRSEQLRCAALDDPAPYFAPLAAQRAAIGQCGAQLGGASGYYTSAAVADDIDDVRAALGIEHLDLLGVSYGTFLMATYAQRHPIHVQSVILSGAYAVNIDSSEGVAATALRRAVSLVCERTGDCDGAAVLRDLAAVADRLRADPMRFDVAFAGSSYPVVLDEWQLAGAVGKLYSGVPDTEAQLDLARAVSAFRDGDPAPVQGIVRDHLVEQASTAALGAGLVSFAMLWAVTCHDYPHDFDLADSVPERSGDYAGHLGALDPADFEPFSPDAWVTRDTFDSGACLGWPDDPTAGPPFAPGAPMPDVPVLVQSGDLDANTASPSGREAAAQFPHSTFVEVPGAGHTPVQSPLGLAPALEFLARTGPR